jgi:hypothetical protein
LDLAGTRTINKKISLVLDPYSEVTASEKIVVASFEAVTSMVRGNKTHKVRVQGTVRVLAQARARPAHAHGLSHCFAVSRFNSASWRVEHHADFASVLWVISKGVSANYLGEFKLNEK